MWNDEPMNVNDTLTDRLRERLAQPLPGLTALSDYVPELCYGRHAAPPDWNARHAAVLVLLYPDLGHWRMPLTKRPEAMQTHSGQVSFPGGEIDGDETPEQAALRELSEELGVELAEKSILGRLSETYIYGSNFLVTPCVAVTDSRPVFAPNPDEVANLLEPRLVDLIDTAAHKVRRIERRGVVFRAPEVIVDGHSVWGATRLILAEFCAGVSEASDRPGG